MINTTTITNNEESYDCNDRDSKRKRQSYDMNDFLPTNIYMDMYISIISKLACIGQLSSVFFFYHIFSTILY